MLPEYTFLPWLRRGLATEITAADRLGGNPEQGPEGRPTLGVELTLARTRTDGSTAGALPSVARELAILGPGDVASLRAEAILRTYPAPNVAGATPGELAFVEFYDEDLPWRYTPAKATVGDRLRPWLALLVLEPHEFDLDERRDALARLSLNATTPLPDTTETWAWAHGQTAGNVLAGGIDAFVDAHPDHALSRLLCPRRLLERREYHAFLVPAFEAGRLAGLGRDSDGVPVQKPAWGTPAFQGDRTLPVYHRWSFTTGASGDFEELALKLQPRPAGQRFGKRALDVSDAGYGFDPAAGIVQLEGALAPPDFTRRPFGDVWSAETRALAGVLDAGELRKDGGGTDLVVVPPVYGRWHAGVPLVADAENDAQLAWLAELNLDLRNRAAAGLGAEVVRQRQEEYVQRAWEQVGRVEEANQRLREAELARSTVAAVHDKHVVGAGDGDRVLILTAAAQGGLTVPAATRTVRGAVDESRVPIAAQAPAFRRITRPQRPLMKRLPGETDIPHFQGGMLGAMNASQDSLSAAPPAPPAASGVALQSVRDAVATSLDELQNKPDSSGRLFIELADLELQVFVSGGGNVDTLAEETFRQRVNTRVDNRYPPTTSNADDKALAQRIKDLVSGITVLRSDPPNGVVIEVSRQRFEAAWGRKVRGKALGALQVLNENPPPETPLSRVTDEADVQQFQNALGVFDAAIVGGRPEPTPPGALAGGLATRVLDLLDPAHTFGDRLAAALPAIADRPPARRLAPVMAYPEFPDPLMGPLRGLSQDHVIPNVSDLPRDTLTLLEPNTRFIESFLAGANHAFAQELLWREYPTDQRGSYFRVFWDRRDALGQSEATDVGPLDGWEGELGAHATAAGGVLVLVVRGELLERYPNTVIYAQEAQWPATPPGPRSLKADGEVIQPVFSGKLDPDITLVGFLLSEERARGVDGHAGFFFILLERPGEPRFGLDATTPAAGRRTWNDLAWDALQFPDATPYVDLSANAALTTTQPQPAAWGRTSADMASILFQSPILFARHAGEMLPT